MLNVDGLKLRLNDGTEGVIRQEGIDKVANKHAFILTMLVELQGSQMRGELRFTAEAYDRLPGQDESEKSEAVRAKLVDWAANEGLAHDFLLAVDADGGGVQFFNYFV